MINVWPKNGPWKNSWNHNFEIGFKTESALKCKPEQLKTIRRITQPLVKHWLVKKGQTNSKQPCSLFSKARKKPNFSSKKTRIFVWSKISGKWKKKNLWDAIFLNVLKKPGLFSNERFLVMTSASSRSLISSKKSSDFPASKSGDGYTQYGL